MRKRQRFQQRVIDFDAQAFAFGLALFLGGEGALAEVEFGEQARAGLLEGYHAGLAEGGEEHDVAGGAVGDDGAALAGRGQ